MGDPGREGGSAGGDGLRSGKNRRRTKVGRVTGYSVHVGWNERWVAQEAGVLPQTDGGLCSKHTPKPLMISRDDGKSLQDFFPGKIPFFLRQE